MPIGRPYDAPSSFPSLEKGIDEQSMFLYRLLYDLGPQIELPKKDFENPLPPRYEFHTPQVDPDKLQQRLYTPTTTQAGMLSGLSSVLERAMRALAGSSRPEPGVASDDTKRYMRYLGTTALRERPTGETHMWRNGQWVRVPPLAEYLQKRER